MKYLRLKTGLNALLRSTVDPALKAEIRRVLFWVEQCSNVHHTEEARGALTCSMCTEYHVRGEAILRAHAAGAGAGAGER